MSAHHVGWQRVAIVCASFVFTAFVLWLFASKFDATEFKSLLMLAGGIAAREFLPAVRRFLGPATDVLSRGQVE